MKKQILKINKKFYDSLEKEESQKILRIYGYDSKDLFLKGLMDKLNNEYDFLDLHEFDFLSNEEESGYHQYNGYIEGDFVDYDLITVSFTPIKGKEGNIFMNQNIVPMITSKTQEDSKFLLNNRIKKICILTTHKSNIFSPEKNIITDSGISNIQMSLKYINTLGFETVDFFHIKNLNIKSRYYSIEELIDHANYLQRKNPTNSQFQQISKQEGVFYGDFENQPVGNEIKFFALKFYAAIFLQKGENIDISRALEKSNDITLRVMSDFIEYISKVDKSLYLVLRDSEDEAEEISEIDIPDEDQSIVHRRPRESLMSEHEYEQEPIYSFNSKGKMIFKTQRKFKKKAFEIHGYSCACHTDGHLYFTSEATNEIYVEGHHMIPMEYQDQYWKDHQRNLDCTINLIPLCSHCHGKIHKSIKNERMEIISEVYSKYKDKLLIIDDKLTLNKFAEFYNVYIY